MRALPADIDFVADPAASPDRMNTAMASLDTRLRALELPARTFDQVLAGLQTIGLERINDALQPYYQQLAAAVAAYAALVEAKAIDGGTFSSPAARIKLRRSEEIGEIPTLLVGETALNEADGLLYWRDTKAVVRSTPLLGLALLASPAFTGTPTSPTAATGDSSTQIATTAFVAAAVQAILMQVEGGAPGALDTLKELADALADDANFATTISAALANRLRFDVAQSLTAAQAAQVRTNLGIEGLGTGQVAFFACGSPPSGYIKANGAAISRVAYGNLFYAIGTYYGGGDGHSTFNIPDVRGLFIRAFDDGRYLDANRDFGSYQADAFASHAHGYTQVDAGYNVNGGYQASSSYAPYAGTTGYSGDTETRPKNLAFMGCIKY